MEKNPFVWRQMSRNLGVRKYGPDIAIIVALIAAIAALLPLLPA